MQGDRDAIYLMGLGGLNEIIHGEPIAEDLVHSKGSAN